MKKYFLVNYETTETAYFNSDIEAFKEMQKRNKYDRSANWKAYTEQGDAVFGLSLTRISGGEI